jgi:hypothetical protein
LMVSFMGLRDWGVVRFARLAKGLALKTAYANDYTR